MKVFIRDMNSCVMRKTDIARYKISFRAAGHEVVTKLGDSDTVLVWTCAFRSDFRDYSLKALNLYQEDSKKRVIACGCLPSIDFELFTKSFPGEYFEWKNEKKAFKELFDIDLKHALRPVVEKALPVSIEEFKKKNPEVKTTYCDQFVKLFISEGCPFKCTYCAERLAFPKYNSFPLQKIIAKCKETVENTGITNVVLYGDCVGEYGKDIGTTLPLLAQELIESIKGVKIGIKNLHPVHYIEYIDFFIQYLEEKKMFLLETPIQSASDAVLNLMGRLYTKRDLIKIFDSFRNADFTEIETHIIAGFPQETREQFNETVDFICEYKPKWVLLSGFMESPGMKARKLRGQIDPEEKRGRVLSAYERINKEGVICNYDLCDYSQESFSYPFIDELVY
ncbi:radical SAM protein [Thermodesulfobacteriota bacterium]